MEMVPWVTNSTFERIGYDSGSYIDPRNFVQDAYASSTDVADRNATLNFNQQSGQPFERQSEDGSIYPDFGIPQFVFTIYHNLKVTY
jgi:hypothetical protein